MAQNSKSESGDLTSTMSISSSPALVPAWCIAGAESDIRAPGSARRREKLGPGQEVAAGDATLLDGKVEPGSLSIVLLPVCSY